MDSGKSFETPIENSGRLNIGELVVDCIFNAERFSEIHSGFLPDAEVETDLPHGLHSGPLALMEVVLFLKRLAPDFRFSFLRPEWVDENTAHLEWRGTGTHTGKSGQLQPTYNKVWVGGFLTIQLRGNKISYLKMNWDPESSFGPKAPAKAASASCVVTNPYPLQARISGAEDKPTLICLSHGFVPSWYYFDRFLPDLTSIRRVITMDSVAIRDSVFHGSSTLRESYSVEDEVKAIVETLDQLGVSGPCDWIGGCNGGRLAFEIYKRHPERVRSLIVNEPALTSLLMPHERWREDAVIFDQKRIQRFTGDITSEDVTWVIKEIGFTEEEAQTWHFRPVFEFFKNAIKGRSASLSSCPTIDDVSKFNLPLLVFQGRETFPVFAAIVDEVTKLVKNCRLVMLEGTHGSSVSLSRELFINSILEFLRDV